MLYTAPGNVLDWMYARQKIKYSYAVHLRDTGTVRFCRFYSILPDIIFWFIILVRVYVAREMDSANW